MLTLLTQNLAEGLAKKLIHYFPTGRPLLIGLSGGIDSIVLLHLLASLRDNEKFESLPYFCSVSRNKKQNREKPPLFPLRAIHIHHGLSPNADNWQHFCQSYCQRLDVPFLTCNIKLDHRQASLEHQARQLRYQAIAKQMLANEILLTAHHRNDQVETFFLALKRGSGVQGLSSMAEFSQLNGIPIYRPLLDVSRCQIESYAKAQGLSWVEDESNNDSHYERNFLRHEVLPILQQRWQSFDRAVARTASLCAEQQALIEELITPRFLENFSSKDLSFDVANFNDISPAQQRVLLRMWLQHLKQPMPSQVQLSKIQNEIIAAGADRNPSLKLGDSVVRRFQQRLFLTAEFQDLTDIVLPLAIGESVILPDQLGRVELFKKEKSLLVIWHQNDGKCQQSEIVKTTATSICIKFYHQGKIHLASGRHESLKKCWQQAGVPQWLRSRIPLIFLDNVFYCAVGYFSARA